MRKEATFTDFSKSLQKRYKGYECKLYKIKEMMLVPTHAQRCRVYIVNRKLTKAPRTAST